mmetsp:Transcript_51537/g.95336  ORF Transcript_51537/g.95336 Transcript_51537/m.95336 type:complete len:308 (-) Transcript_51537:64-987(-)
MPVKPTLIGVCPHCCKEFFQHRAFENHCRNDYQLCPKAPLRAATSSLSRGEQGNLLEATAVTSSAGHMPVGDMAGMADEITSAAVVFPDPRYSGSVPVEVIAFYFPDALAPCDRLCQKPFLGNFYDLGEVGLELKGKRFRCAEAAFQALKFWDKADHFANLTGSEAWQLKTKLAIEQAEDRTYAGYGSNWAGMWAVLVAKFRPGTPCHQNLLQTGDAFLLEHNSKTGRDKIWSNNGPDGDGRNWLGLQLMMLRDILLGDMSQAFWLPYLEDACGIDINTGEHATEKGSSNWRDVVSQATQAVVAQLT